ncbi:MAG: ACT domain-containing protein [Eubacteriales bacterium]|nr:ACT domain-containing protein [Eubacteriales bacterium]
MEKNPKYFIVEGSLLPDVFLKTAQVNRLLQSGAVRTVGEATQQIGLSRSAYYKYKDGIKPFFEASIHSIITFQILLSDEAGLLSNILRVFAQFGANILTINQTIPVNGQAAVTVSAQTDAMNQSIEELMEALRRAEGVGRLEIIARE